MAKWNDDAHEAVPDDDVLFEEARERRREREEDEDRARENHLTPLNSFMRHFAPKK